ncbi:MAG: anti-sigma factor antagonist [Verrucomicrobia bacterium]|nr:MAG: anti-sigma factor antagonist [Verrucomicrobiota bacterium]
MTAPIAHLKSRFCEKNACIKVVGRANFNLAVEFNCLLTDFEAKGCTAFRLDLGECTLMDSTFLGVLSGFGLKFSLRNGAAEPHLVQLINPNDRIAELLENLGVIHLFQVTRGEPENWDDLADCAPGDATTSREVITKTCLEAHQKLVEINPENEQRFKDVTKFLAEDLERLKKKDS